MLSLLFFLLALLTFGLVASALVALAVLIGRRVIRHVKEDPEAGKALMQHVITPLVSDQKKRAAEREGE